MKYTLVRAHRGDKDLEFATLKEAQAYAERAWGRRLYRAESFLDSEERRCWELFDRAPRYYPDGDPYALFIRREK